uniref:Uncharacterized protein n=1 Tax=Romanomermis culicivorax TaxID=13658 RepID=A0A915J9G0_ROMCU
MHVCRAYSLWIFRWYLTIAFNDLPSRSELLINDRSRRNVDDNSSHDKHFDDDCRSMEEYAVCDPTQGGVCRNRSCVSVCSTAGPQFRQCSCPNDEDRFCYLCCGSPDRPCRPAQDYSIFKPNGELWERDICSRCRSWPDGLYCDDRDRRRVCANGKCVANVCHDKPEGSYCDLQKLKMCVDGECRDPCREVAPHLLTCECDDFRSDDRCQLCCFDPSTKRCENAFARYQIINKNKRPIFRDGLRCRPGATCNKYGLCGAANLAVRHWTDKLTIELSIGFIFLIMNIQTIL